MAPPPSPSCPNSGHLPDEKGAGAAVLVLALAVVLLGSLQVITGFHVAWWFSPVALPLPSPRVVLKICPVVLISLLQDGLPPPPPASGTELRA